MDQKSEHFNNLSTARDRVIVECRKLAALNTPHEIPRSEELNEGFIAVQNTIDEINRVLAKPTSSRANNHRNAVRLASESCPQSLGFRSLP